MKRLWLFTTLVLLFACLFLLYQLEKQQGIVLEVAPVVTQPEIGEENPHLPTGEPVEAIISGLPTDVAEVSEDSAVANPYLPQAGDYPDIPVPAVSQHSKAVDRKGYFVYPPATGSRVICVFDPVGGNGDVFRAMTDFQSKSLRWGGNFELKPYTDESVMVDEFKSGSCDGVVMSGVKSRDFNRFTASIEAVGAITNDAVLRTALTTLMTLSDAKAQKLLRNGPYEVAGILPVGAIYAFLRDRSWDSLNTIQGKKISVLEGDKVSASMVRQAGGSPVVATTSSFAGKFNSGNVDITFAPAAAYEPLELYRGLDEKGGVIDLVLGQLTLQMLIRWERFPEHFGANARETALDSFDDAFAFIEKSRLTIDQKYWITPNKKDLLAHEEVLRQSRITLRDKGVYDAKMLKLLRKIRCKQEAARAECAEKLE